MSPRRAGDGARGARGSAGEAARRVRHKPTRWLPTSVCGAVRRSVELELQLGAAVALALAGGVASGCGRGAGCSVHRVERSTMFMEKGIL